MLDLEIVCPICGEVQYVRVNKEAYNKWKNKEGLIQDLMPELTPEQRELLISGTCGACWDTMFVNWD